MSKFILSTSSCADLTESYAKEHNIVCLPFTFLIEGKEHPDDFGHSMSYTDFYTKVRAGEPSTTSMINAEAYEEYFKSAIAGGLPLLHIEFSSALSGSYQNAKNVADKMNGEFGEKRIYVIDSLCASRGLGLLVDYAVNMRDADKTIEEVAEWVEGNKLNLIHWFTVDDLNHLRRGGRLSRASAFFGSMLKIKPVMDVDDRGRLIPHFKVRGRKKSILTMVEHMQMDIKNPDGQTVFICHGDCIDDAEFLKAKVLESFPTIKEVAIHYTGPVIGSHSGPGTLALFYMGKERYKD